MKSIQVCVNNHSKASGLTFLLRLLATALRIFFTHEKKDSNNTSQVRVCKKIAYNEILFPKKMLISIKRKQTIS